MTKTMGWDDTDNEGTDYNDNGEDRDQGMKTNDEEDNDEDNHKMTTEQCGTQTMDVYHKGMREDGDGTQTPIPHHCEHLLTGWTRC